MEGTGWIKIHRSILDWEWYDDVKAKCLFLHLLLKANYEEKEWHGITIKRGQFVTSRATLARELRFTEQSIREALNRLKATNEITIKTTNKYTLITINKFESYQDYESDNNQESDKQNNQQTTNKQPTNNQQTTTTKEIKKDKKDKNSGSIVFTPPTLEETVLYFSMMYTGLDGEAQRFYDYYTANGWKVGRNRMKDWHAAVRNWVRNIGNYTTKQEKSNGKTRTISSEDIHAIVAAGQAIANQQQG